MRLAFILILTFISSSDSFSQHMFRAIVKDAETRATLPGAAAVIIGTTIGATDQSLLFL